MNIKLEKRQEIVKMLLKAYKVPSTAIDIVLEEMNIVFTEGRIYQAGKDVKARNIQRLYEAMPTTFEEERN